MNVHIKTNKDLIRLSSIYKSRQIYNINESMCWG